METTLRRLYVGGISPSVTDAELSERFGRFGKVDEVEVISRKDEQGNPLKTFAYMNINISDADLKKCLSILNKTKWKGGVLQIEIAKESFLHKLELERQAAKEKNEPKEQSHPQDDLLQSLEKAGVTDFQMKAAVPGTEVPNHKDWVVSKYGRVLPVLHLKGNKKSKIVKYDPSKYCHNIKKLDQASLESTPVSQLTWHLDGGDDDISKKRRGEFPPFKSPVKRSKVHSYLNTSQTDERAKSIRTPQTTLQMAKDAVGSQHRRDTSRGYMGNKSINRMFDDEYDSEEELKTILEKEKVVKESGRHAEDSNIEIVDDSFTPSYLTHWEIGKHRASNGGTQDENGYDSADTDEIITVAKTSQKCNNGKKEKSNSLAKQNSNEVSRDLNIPKCNVKPEDDTGTEDSNDSDTEDGSDSYSDEEYESMMQNCYRLDLSIGDLEALVKEAGESDSDDTNRSNDSGEEYDPADPECVQRDTPGELKGSERKQTPKKIQTSDAAPDRDLNIPKCNVKPEDDTGTEEDSNDSDTEDGSDSYSDEEYESMMQNCYRLDLSLRDLEALVKEAGESDGDDTNESNDSDEEYDPADTECVQRDTPGKLKGSEGKQTPKKTQTPDAAPDRDLKVGNCSKEQSAESNSSHAEGESGSMKGDLCQANLTVPKLKSVEESVSKSSSDNDKTDVANKGEKAVRKTQKETKSNNTAVIGNLKRKKGIEPEDIVASILEEDDDDSSNDHPKRKKKQNPPNKPPAFKGLGSLMPLSVSNETKAPVSSPKSRGQATMVVAVSDETNGTTSKSKVKEDYKDNERPSKPVKKALRSGQDDDSSSSYSSSSISSDDESSSATSPVTKPKVSKTSSAKEQSTSKAKQLQDNQKRLAAMEERRKEREQQKQAIQGALLKPDSQAANKSQHIVFNSESEKESEKEEEASTSNAHSDKAIHVKAKLFDSSGEDSDDEEEKDDERFEIKTQYEGRSGEKLMRLQSRFGTDERFKMDARFLEDSSEGEEDTEQSEKLQVADDDGLSAEKRKNLDILQSILKINVEPQHTSKKAAKAKQFKDLNALQYDPTKEDHAVFEAKAEGEKKESKAEKRKKRLEAEKLPEVSKETFHEVIADFKEVFGAPKPLDIEEPETTWDQMEEPQKMEVERSVANVDFSFQKTEEPAGFTFSFFGTSTEKSVSQDEPYKIESIKAAKVAWQEDPRFQDSSSEGEEEEEEDTAVTAVNSSSQKSSGLRFFFFVKNDTRLKEGPKMFFRSSKCEQKAEDWDDMRDSLIEDCKKRHRDAKRKLKSGH